eukprot:ANDGO_04233.mRNA.1 Sperm receptor for egg jelly
MTNAKRKSAISGSSICSSSMLIALLLALIGCAYGQCPGAINIYNSFVTSDGPWVAAHGGGTLLLTGNSFPPELADNLTILIDNVYPCLTVSVNSSMLECLVAGIPGVASYTRSIRVVSVDPVANCTVSSAVGAFTSIQETQEWFRFTYGPWAPKNALEISSIADPRISNFTFQSNQGFALSFFFSQQRQADVGISSLLVVGNVNGTSRRCDALQNGIHLWHDNQNGMLCLEYVVNGTGPSVGCQVRCSRSQFFRPLLPTDGFALPDTYVFVVVDVSQSGAYVWVDGNLEIFVRFPSNATSLRLPTGPQTVHFGRRCPTGGYCPLQAIDHIAVFSRSLGPETVAKSLTSDPRTNARVNTSLIALYSFDGTNLAQSMVPSNGLSFVSSSLSSKPSYAKVEGIHFAECPSQSVNCSTFGGHAFFRNDVVLNQWNARLSDSMTTDFRIVDRLSSCEQLRAMGYNRDVETVLYSKGLNAVVVHCKYMSGTTPSAFLRLVTPATMNFTGGKKIWEKLPISMSSNKICASCMDFVTFDPPNSFFKGDFGNFSGEAVATQNIHFEADFISSPFGFGQRYVRLFNVGAFNQDFTNGNRTMSITASNGEGAYIPGCFEYGGFCITLDAASSSPNVSFPWKLVTFVLPPSTSSDGSSLAYPSQSLTVQLGGRRPTGSQSWYFSFQFQLKTARAFTNQLADNDGDNPANWDGSVLPGAQDTVFVGAGTLIRFRTAQLSVLKFVLSGGTVVGPGANNDSYYIQAQGGSLSTGTLQDIRIIFLLPTGTPKSNGVDMSPKSGPTLTLNNSTLEFVNTSFSFMTRMNAFNSRFVSNSQFEFWHLLSPFGNLSDFTLQIKSGGTGLIRSSATVAPLSLIIEPGAMAVVPFFNQFTDVLGSQKNFIDNKGVLMFGYDAKAVQDVYLTDADDGGNLNGAIFKLFRPLSENVRSRINCPAASPAALVLPSRGMDVMLTTNPLPVNLPNSYIIVNVSFGDGSSYDCILTNSSSTGTISISGGVLYSGIGILDVVFTQLYSGPLSSLSPLGAVLNVSVPQILRSCATLIRVTVNSPNAAIAVRSILIWSPQSVVDVSRSSLLSIEAMSLCRKSLPIRFSNDGGMVRSSGFGSLMFSGDWSRGGENTLKGQFFFSNESAVVFDINRAPAVTNTATYFLPSSSALSVSLLIVNPRARLIVDGSLIARDALIAGQLLFTADCLANNRSAIPSISIANISGVLVGVAQQMFRFDGGSSAAFSAVNSSNGSPISGALTVSSAVQDEWNRWIELTDADPTSELFLRFDPSVRSLCSNSFSCVLSLDRRVKRGDVAVPLNREITGDYFLGAPTYAKSWILDPAGIRNFSVLPDIWMAEIVSFHAAPVPFRNTIVYGPDAGDVEQLNHVSDLFTRAEFYADGGLVQETVAFDNVIAVGSLMQVEDCWISRFHPLGATVKFRVTSKSSTMSLPANMTVTMSQLSAPTANAMLFNPSTSFLSILDSQFNYGFDISFLMSVDEYALSVKPFSPSPAISVCPGVIKVGRQSLTVLPSLLDASSLRRISLRIQGFKSSDVNALPSGLACVFNALQQQNSSAVWDSSLGVVNCSVPVSVAAGSVNVILQNGTIELGSGNFSISNVATFSAASVDVNATFIRISFSSPTNMPSSPDCSLLLLLASRLTLGERTGLQCSWQDASNLVIQLGQLVVWNKDDPFFNISIVPGSIRDGTDVTAAAQIPTLIRLPFSPPLPMFQISPSQAVVNICDAFSLSAVLVSGGLNRAVSSTWRLLSTSMTGFNQSLPYPVSSSLEVSLGDPFRLPGSFVFEFTGVNAFGYQFRATVNVTRRSNEITSASIVGPSPATVRISQALTLNSLVASASCLSSLGFSVDYEWNISGSTLSAVAIGKAASAKGLSSIVFPGFAFVSGNNYSVSLRVKTVPFLSSALLAEFQFSAFALPLSAVVDQGSFVEQGVASPLRLSSLGSVDPDNEPGITPTFLWSCLRFANSTAAKLRDESQGAVCSEISSVAKTASVLDIPAKVLQVSFSYVFAITYSKGSRSSTSSIVVFTKSGNPPLVRISQPVTKVSAAEKVVVTAEVSSPDPRPQIQWQFVSGSPSFDLTNSSLILSSDKSANLVIAPGILVSGQTYSFEVVVTDQWGANSSAFRNVIVNTPPAGGSCSVIPDSGFELETEFTLSCSGWSDEDAPIQYDVYLVNRVDLSVVALPLTVEDPNRVILLPNQLIYNTPKMILPPSKSSTGNMTLLFNIRDSFRSSVLVSANVKVVRKVFATEGARISFVNNVVNTELKEKLQSNDTTAILQLTTSIAQSLTSNSSAASAASSLISQSSSSQDSSKCPASCYNGVCVTQNNVAFCRCNAGWGGPVCNLNRTEIDDRARVNAQLLQGLLQVSASPSSTMDVTESKQLLRSTMDAVVTITENPLMIDDSGAAKMESVISNVVLAAQNTGADSQLFERMNSALSQYVLMVGLGESLQQRQSFSEQGRNRSATADRKNAQTVNDLMRQMGQSIAVSLSAGERAVETSTSVFVNRIQKKDASQLGGSRIEAGGSLLVADPSSNVTSAMFDLPASFSPCQNSNESSNHVTNWNRNPYSFAMGANDTTASTLVTFRFTDSNGTECSVANLQVPIVFYIPLSANASSAMNTSVIPSCSFFDDAAQNYSTKGVQSKVLRNSRGHAYAVQCNTTHLTSFVTFEAAASSVPDVALVDVTSTNAYNADLLTSDIFYVVLAILLIGWSLMILGYIKDRRAQLDFLSAAVITVLPSSASASVDMQNPCSAQPDCEQPADAHQILVGAKYVAKDSESQPVSSGGDVSKPMAEAQADKANGLPKDEESGIAPAEGVVFPVGIYASTNAGDVAAYRVEGDEEIVTLKQEDRWVQFRRRLPPKMKHEHLVLSMFFRDPHELVTRPQRVMLLMCLIFLAMAINAFFSPSKDASFGAKFAVSVLSSWMAEPLVVMMSLLFARIAADKERNRRRKEKVLRGETTSNAAALAVAAPPGLPVLQPLTDTSSPSSASTQPQVSAFPTADNAASAPLFSPRSRAAVDNAGTAPEDQQFDSVITLDSGFRSRRYNKQMKKLRDGRPVYGPPSIANILIIMFTMILFTLLIVFWLLQAGAEPFEIGIWVGAMALLTIFFLYAQVWRRRPRLDEEGVRAMAQKRRDDHDKAFADDGAQFLFPAWCVVLVYILAALIQAFAVHVIFIYALMFDADSRHFWYIDCALSFCQDMLIVEPLVIIGEALHETFLDTVAGEFVDMIMSVIC